MGEQLRHLPSLAIFHLKPPKCSPGMSTPGCSSGHGAASHSPGSGGSFPIPAAPAQSHSLLDSLQNHKGFLEVYPSWGQKFSKREEGKKTKKKKKKNKHHLLNISGFRNAFPGQREEVPEPG